MPAVGPPDRQSTSRSAEVGQAVFGSRPRVRRPVLLLIVFGVFLVIVGVTATAQALMVSVHSSSSSLTAIVQSDVATLRGFAHAGLHADVASGNLSVEQRARLEALMATLTSKSEILRVELRLPDGRIIASTEAAATDTSVVVGPEFRSAVNDNRAHVSIVPAEAADAGPGGFDSRTLLREFLPVSQAGDVVLVVGVWRDAEPILGSLDNLRRDVVLVVISAAVVAGFALFLIFRAAQARISRQTEALLEASRRDPLTDLLNHGALVGYLAEEIERARRSDLKVRVALVDLDNFRLLNDNHGHRAGDEVMLELAELLRERLPADLVCGRYGPDEFLLIAPAGSEVELRPAVEHLRQALAELTLQFEATERLPVTVSAGLCAYPEHGTSVTVLLATAASALGEAKASGGDAVREAGESQAESSVASSFDVLQGLVFAVDTKDRYTRRHSEEVARYAEFLGAHLELDDELMRSLHIAGLLHDVGKIGIPDHILRKPGRLTAEEADVVKQHVALGDMIVRELPNIETVRAGVRHHHERWDGRGYLTGLSGEEIPFIARILAIADAFSAMTTTRPYRKALSVSEALRRLGDAAGSQLDEGLVSAFIEGMESAEDAPLPNVELPAARVWVPRRLVA